VAIWSLVPAVLLVLVGSPAWASWLDTADPRWIPSLGVSGGATMQDQEAAVESNCIIGGFGDGETFPNCPWIPGDPRGPAPLRPSDRGSDWAVSPFVAMNLQLMTPVIPVPLRPRLFLSGELIAFFGPKRNIATEGNPSGDIRTPQDKAPNTVTALGLKGIGSQTSAKIRTRGFGANIGIAIPFQFRGRQILIKPSAAWMQFTVDVAGKVQAGLKDDFTLPHGVPPFGNNIREIYLNGSSTVTANAVGPALEIELDTGLFGPIGSSVYIFGAGYKVLGDRSVEMEDVVTFFPPTDDGIGPDQYTGRWKWKMDPWVGRIGVGFRIHLLPK
jgi:hypothetical protein